jgi:serine/threonine-protein kinase
VERNPGNIVPDSAAGAAASGLHARPAQPIPAKSIAVLPFENLSTDKGNAYFADGMQDLILTKLADIGDLKVISRTSTAKYASHPDDLKTVGLQLGVATILEGSVQKAGNQVLINVQLINAKTDSHIWAQSYTRTLDNIFGVEGEVAEKIATALNAKLTPAESAAVARIPTHDKQAYDAYLKASYYLNDFNRTGDPDENAQAVALLTHAVQLDPAFREAYLALTLVYVHEGQHLDAAEKAAAHALALDPNNPDAHRMMAYVMAQKGEMDQAIAQAQQSVRLQPGAAALWNGLGNVYSWAARLDDAETAYRRAIALDPKPGANGWARLNLSYTLEARRNYAAARDSAQWMVVRDPGNVNAVVTLAQIDEIGWGDLDAARDVLQAAPAPAASSGMLSDAWFWLDLYGRDYAAAVDVIQKAPASWFTGQYPLGLYLGLAHQAQGDAVRAKVAFSEARTQLEGRIKASPDNADLHANMALVLAGLGERDAALSEARRAIDLKPVGKYPGEGIAQIFSMAAVQSRVGNVGAAIKLLDQLLQMPAGEYVSVPLLKIDPTWDPVRHDLRFQALLKKYAQSVPASAAGGGAE